MEQATGQLARLTPRMRECLRLVFDRKSSKEIAVLLSTAKQPLTESTVSSYIAEAVRLIGAKNRKDAAERLHAYEASIPKEVGPKNLRVAAPDCDATESSTRDAVTAIFPLPLRRQGAIENDLSIRQRIGWIFVIAIGVAIGIGAVANVLQFINGVVVGHK